MHYKDHISLMGTNPLINQNLDEFGSRFPGISNTYGNFIKLIRAFIAEV